VYIASAAGGSSAGGCAAGWDWHPAIENNMANTNNNDNTLLLLFMKSSYFLFVVYISLYYMQTFCQHLTKQQQNVLIKLNDINYAKNKKRDFSLRQKSHFIYA
jgi:hypothetical protein